MHATGRPERDHLPVNRLFTRHALCPSNDMIRACGRCFERQKYTNKNMSFGHRCRFPKNAVHIEAAAGFVLDSK